MSYVPGRRDAKAHAKVHTPKAEASKMNEVLVTVNEL